jgi:hypothetical protein
MDAADSFCPNHPADDARADCSRGRCIRVVGTSGSLSATSDLGQNEPVTDAEIGLIMTTLGDAIMQILNSGASRT